MKISIAKLLTFFIPHRATRHRARFALMMFGVEKHPKHGKTAITKFVHPKRLDVCAKYAYARLREQAPALEWGAMVYEKHIAVVNGFHEKKPRKNGKQDFFDHFHRLLDNVKQHGWNNAEEAIPLHKKDKTLIIDGAHRLAACLTTEIQPPTRVSSTNWTPQYSHAFFSDNGLDADALDFMVTEYMRLRSDCYVVVVWPAGFKFINLIREVLAEHCTIVCQKNIHLSGDNALMNIVRQVYFDEDWIGGAGDNFDGVRRCANNYWGNDSQCGIFLVQANSRADVKAAKKQARKCCGLENAALHTTDTYRELMRIGQMFFNQNSIELINTASLNETPKFQERLIEYCAAVKHRDEYAIHGSAVLEAFGLRGAKDLDYVSTSDRKLPTGKIISMDNEKANYTDHSVAELVYDPRNYFYYCGVKFVSLDIVRRMKEKRGEAKDKEDIKLIDAFAAQPHKLGNFVIAGNQPKIKTQ